MVNKNEWMIVGLITSPHGINGQVKVKSLSDFEERFLKKGIRWLQKENEPPSNRTAALFFVTLCTNPLYPLYIELLSFTTTKEPGSIGLEDNSIKHSFSYNI